MTFILPQVQAMLDQMKLMMAGQPKLRDLPTEAARAGFAGLAMLTELPALPVPWHDDVIAGVPVRCYVPAGADDATLFLFCHGGGFVIGNRDTHHSLAAQIADHLGMKTVSVDYRLAPEHPFPAAHDDCLAVAQALLAGGATRLVVGGDSAGGNLAAACAQAFRAQVKGQLLLYPVTDFLAQGGSLETLANGYVLEKADMDWFENSFIRQGTDKADPRLSPLRGDLAGLPPCVLVTCGLDPLRDQGEAYVAALQAAGNKAVLHTLAGAVHGCFGMRAAIPQAQAVLLRALDALKAMI
jgi:acetyl esterase